MGLQRKIAQTRNRRLIGTQTPILVDGLSKETDLLWEGRMPTQAPEIDGVTLINDFEGAEPRPGEIRRLRVTEAHDYDLVGTLLASETEGVPGGAPLSLVQLEPAPGPRISIPAL
jgi:ribosomal protein S12 methylthiotransferase